MPLVSASCAEALRHCQLQQKAHVSATVLHLDFLCSSAGCTTASSRCAAQSWSFLADSLQ
eukprot:scaffold111692_cov13-Tisochrysis_lutea.AAC.2